MTWNSPETIDIKSGGDLNIRLMCAELDFPTALLMSFPPGGHLMCGRFGCVLVFRWTATMNIL